MGEAVKNMKPNMVKFLLDIGISPQELLTEEDSVHPCTKCGKPNCKKSVIRKSLLSIIREDRDKIWTPRGTKRKITEVLDMLDNYNQRLTSAEIEFTSFLEDVLTLP